MAENIMFPPPTYRLKRKKERKQRKKVVGKEGGLTGNLELPVCREGPWENGTAFRVPCNSDSGFAFSSDKFKNPCRAALHYLLTDICHHK